MSSKNNTYGPMILLQMFVIVDYAESIIHIYSFFFYSYATD